MILVVLRDKCMTSPLWGLIALNVETKLPSFLLNQQREMTVLTEIFIATNAIRKEEETEDQEEIFN